MIATTLRLPDGLKKEADAYAENLGLSLNALATVALRDYLDRRSGGVLASPADRAQAAAKTAGKATPVVSGRRQPCPCGSGRQYRHCCEALHRGSA